MALELPEIQGIILRSYRMALLRALVLTIRDAARIRTVLGALAGDVPELRVLTAEPWDAKPDYCVNIGITADGLRALKVPDAVLTSFPPEFVAGALGRVDRVGDTGANAPANWIAPFNSADVHIILLISAQSTAVLEDITSKLLAAVGGAASITRCPDGVLPPDHRAHFGYVDGISQPRVAGVIRQKSDGSGIPDFTDPLTPVPPGAFVLGYESPHPGLYYPMPAPASLGMNGSFAALRILKQDVVGFEQFLTQTAQATGLDRELVAAKLCGRWRTGVPVSLSPDNPSPAAVPMEQWNQFDYADDPAGARCPLGSHIRRNNPRRTPVAGDGGERHRIVRRGLPYGPPYDPSQPYDGIERGLLGLFICGSLLDQFEFLMKEWVNDGNFAGLGDDKDPILGNQPPGGGRFHIPVSGKPRITLKGMSGFIATRGAAYCFLPAIAALRYLAKLS